MSGIIGHTTYAILAAKAAAHHRLPIAPILQRHCASYLAGSYLGSDVQTLPAAVCQDTGEEVGYCAARITESPITGGPVTPWKLSLEGTQYLPLEIHRRFYGRAHLVFGWDEAERQLAAGETRPHAGAPTNIEKNGVPVGVFYDRLKRIRLARWGKKK